MNRRGANMSSASFAILIEKVNMNNLEGVLGKEIGNGIIYSLNPKWTAIVLEDFIEHYDSLSSELSIKLGSKVLSFYQSEDYGWGINIYEHGSKVFFAEAEDEIEVLSLSYSEDKEPLFQMIADPEKAKEIEKLLQQNHDNELEVLHLIKRELGFEELEFALYETVLDVIEEYELDYIEINH